MERRKFIKNIFFSVLGLGGLFALNGCMSGVSQTAEDKDAGDPYKCSLCGYLTRSKKDITQDRCPRCKTKNLKKITEKEMEKELGEEKGK